MNRYLFLIVIITLFVSCSSNTEEVSEETNTPEPQTKPNILLVIADDFGLDACPGYSLGSTKPNMPVLQGLMNSGLKFNNVWSSPTCSPTRAGILTGKYGFRTGITSPGSSLSTTETSIQSYLDSNTGSAYGHAVIGKWHLSSNNAHPNNMGVDYFAGSISNVSSYTNWTLNVNGSTSNSTEYMTSKLTDLAIDWIDDQTKPWFLWLAYTAPHSPFHLPPNNLHSQGSLPSDDASISANPMPYYFAALEALDTEMGRLIDSMTQEEKDNTVIIFIGDNGTPNQVAQDYTNRRAKGTVYQGGVNVPMIVSGNGVTRANASEDALINTLDIFATVADLAETGNAEINDSKSFKELFSNTNATKKDYIFTEGDDGGNLDVTIRDDSHKYILFWDGSEAFYDLSNNPLESPNLLNANQLPLSDANSAIKDALTSELQSITN
ncbi:sulfatase-like hydrolase/transferase [Seonamhaeicola sp. MEBiC1930]|uniref:sulfatase-like hydrolase/transferase n=1 Tax=Seonamhaeicola sp. MEBiC01930 TaxID=2976768 RepID=UPI003249E8E8